MHWRTNNIKMEIDELEKLCTKNRTCYYFHDIIKIDYFDFGIILMDEKSYQNILIYEVSCKTLMDANCVLCLMENMGLLEIMMALNT